MRSLFLNVGRALCVAVFISVALLTFSPQASAQMRLANESEVPFHGWINTTTDADIPTSGSWPGGSFFVRGQRSGKDTWGVDVWCSLSAGEHRSLDWNEADGQAQPPGWKVEGGIVQWFGGSQLKIGGQAMTLVSIEADGAAFRSTYIARVGHFVVDAWLRWYPSQPAWIEVETFVTFSDQKTEALAYTSPEIRIEFGSGGAVFPLGNVQDNVLIPAGTEFADGQGRADMLYLVFADRVRNATEWASFGALSERHVGGCGIEKLWADGNPVYKGNAHSWGQQNRERIFASIRSWSSPVIGPAANATVTGAQEDQVFVRMEPMLDASTAPIIVAAALKMAQRPSNYRNPNGTFVNYENTSPRLIMWNGRPHWHTGVSPNQLGKASGLHQPSVPGGFFGPDREHLLYNTVGAGARFSNSPSVQQILKQVANLYLLTDTIRSGWSTSTPDAARSIGWAGIFVVWIDRELEDRTLAAQVVQRWRDRVNLIYVPQLTDAVIAGDGWWDKRHDARLGLPAGVWGAMPWQSSIGAWGLDYACRHVGPTAGIALARQQAEQCVDRNWIQDDDGRWLGIGNQPYLKSERAEWLADPSWRPGVTWFERTWDVGALDVVLRYQPDHAKARSIMGHLDSTGGADPSWTPPK